MQCKFEWVIEVSQSILQESTPLGPSVSGISLPIARDSKIISQCQFTAELAGRKHYGICVRFGLNEVPFMQ